MRASPSGCYMFFPRYIILHHLLGRLLSSDWGIYQRQSSGMDHVNAYLTASADDSINLHRSGGSSSKRKDPVATCSGENIISTSGIVQGEKNNVIYCNATRRASKAGTVTRPNYAMQ